MRGRHGIRHRDLMQRLQPTLLLLQPIDHHRALGVIELEACKFLGRSYCRVCYLLAIRNFRPEHAGQERRAEPDAGEVRHERATVINVAR